MKIVILGGTGLIGQALTESYLRDGHRVIIVSRRPNAAAPRGAMLAQWDGRYANGWGATVNGADAVINLAGENLSAGRWTEQQKRAIRDSRVNAGHAIVQAIQEVADKPRVLLQISGVGAYGTSEAATFDETAPFGSDFLADVSHAWEDSTLTVERMGVRRVIARSGVVLSLKSGALPRILLPFKLFAGGPLGSGRQWLSWVHIEDEVRALRFLVENENARGVYNISGQPIKNGQLAKTIGKQIHRPSFFPVPAIMLRLLLGEMSVMVLEGQNVTNEKIIRLGFSFQYPTAEIALADLLSAPGGKEV